MSPRNGDRLLEAIIGEIIFLRSWETSGALDRYPLDPIIKRAVERSPEVVGESVAQLRRGRPDLAARITSADLIVEFRNVLAHAFWKVDPQIIRNVIRGRLPSLYDEAVVLRALEKL